MKEKPNKHLQATRDDTLLRCLTPLARVPEVRRSA